MLPKDEKPKRRRGIVITTLFLLLLDDAENMQKMTEGRKDRRVLAYGSDTRWLTLSRRRRKSFEKKHDSPWRFRIFRTNTQSDAGVEPELLSIVDLNTFRHERQCSIGEVQEPDGAISGIVAPIDDRLAVLTHTETLYAYTYLVH